MKKCCYPFLFLFIISCGESKSTDQEDTREEVTIALDSSLQDSLIIVEAIDSFLWIGPQKFSVVDARDTIKFQGTKTSAWENEDSVMDHYSAVSRYGDSLIFNPENGEIMVLENIPIDDDVEYDCAYYYFQGDVSNSNYWEVFSIGYEYHWYVLVNKANGDTTITRGPSAFSESGDYVMTGNPDLEAAFTYNGLELFESKNEELHVIGKMEIPDWGPFSIKWISEDQVIITSGLVEYDNGYKRTFKNVILTMVED